MVVPQTVYFDKCNEFWLCIPLVVASEALVVVAAVVSFVDAAVVVVVLVVLFDVVIDVVILVDEDVDVSINNKVYDMIPIRSTHYNHKKAQFIKCLLMSNLPAKTMEDKASAKTEIVVNRICPISSDSCR